MTRERTLEDDSDRAALLAGEPSRTQIEIEARLLIVGPCFDLDLCSTRLAAKRGAIAIRVGRDH